MSKLVLYHGSSEIIENRYMEKAKHIMIMAKVFIVLKI